MVDAIAIHQAYQRGDLEALETLLGHPPDFPNSRGSQGVGDNILEYAIYHSPIGFIRTLLELGADPNYGDHAGFPSLIAALGRDDAGQRREIIDLLVSYGADIQQRGTNDYTPLHYAVIGQDFAAVELLLSHGADLSARTRIDACATPLEEAESLGLSDIARMLRTYMAAQGLDQ